MIIQKATLRRCKLPLGSSKSVTSKDRGHTKSRHWNSTQGVAHEARHLTLRKKERKKEKKRCVTKPNKRCKMERMGKVQSNPSFFEKDSQEICMYYNAQK
jgi:hypothetical protein